MVPAHVTWVIGSGGLLGGALESALVRRSGALVQTSPVGWTTGHAGEDLSGGLTRLVATTGAGRLGWRIAWCAGAGVTGTTDAALDLEVNTLVVFLEQLATTAGLGPGTVFLASSAGGLYAGGHAGRPYRESDEPTPNSAYGRAKLAAEAAVTAFGARTGNSIRIGRISNLYGPGQNLSKGQGLISHLCRSTITRQPVSVYVSLDTIRDYLFVDDCAELIADLLDRPRDARTTVKLLATGHGTTIASLIAVCRQVFKRAPLVVLGSSPNARFQVKDLRFDSQVWPELDRRTLTPLPVGIASTAAGMLRTAQRG